MDSDLGRRVGDQMRLTADRFLFYVVPFCTFLYLIIIELPHTEMTPLEFWLCIAMVAVWPLAYWWFEFAPGYLKRHPNVATETSGEYEQRQELRRMHKAQWRAKQSKFYRFITHPTLLVLCFTALATLLYLLLHTYY